MIIDALPEQFSLLTLPVLERPDGPLALQGGLRELAVVEVDVAQEGPLQVLAALEAVALQDVLDPAVEALDHAVGLGPHRRGQAVLDAEVRAEQVELVLSGGGALAQAEEAVGESLAVVGQHARDLHRGRALQVAQEAARVGSSLRRIDAHEDPPRRPVDGHEEIAARGFVRHLRQILDVDVQVAWLIGLEATVGRLGLLRLQRLQIAHTMAAQAAVEARPRDLWIEKLAHHREQVVEWQQKRPAQRHRDGLLGGRQGRLQPVRRVAPVVDGVAVAPLPDGLLGDAVALGHQPGRFAARLDRRPDLRRRGGLLVQRDQHVPTPSRTSRRIDLAMNRADRRGSM